MKRPVLVSIALTLAACGPKRTIPAPEAPWMPLGGTSRTLTLLDSADIRAEGARRVVRLRFDSLAATPEGDPVVVPGARREARYRVECGARRVQSADAAADTSWSTFDRHPLGPRVFPAVCNALGVIATRD